jgi:hypothetical protein
VKFAGKKISSEVEEIIHDLPQYKDNDDNSDDIIISHNTVLHNTTVPTRVAQKCCV